MILIITILVISKIKGLNGIITSIKILSTILKGNNNLKINENNIDNRNDFRNNKNNNINRSDDSSLNNFSKDFNNINQKIKLNKLINSAKIRFLSPSAKGLVNIGATCYMNATIQCLAHIHK